MSFAGVYIFQEAPQTNKFCILWYSCHIREVKVTKLQVPVPHPHSVARFIIEFGQSSNDLQLLHNVVT